MSALCRPIARLRRLLGDIAGASAAEFAMVLPLLILLLFGIIDAGRLLYDLNRAKKVAQYGARVAAVVDPVEGAIASESFIGKTVGGVTLTQGDTIPASAMGLVTCQTSGTTIATLACDTNSSGTSLITGATSPNATSFGEIVKRMRLMVGETGTNLDAGYLTAANVVVTYRGSGIGYAGNPYGADVSPLVTVGLRDLEFVPTFLLNLVNFTLPPVESTLTAEDMASHHLTSSSPDESN